TTQGEAPLRLLGSSAWPSRLLGVRAEYLFCIHEEVREKLALDCSVQDAEQKISGRQVESLPPRTVAVLDVDRIHAGGVPGIDAPEECLTVTGGCPGNQPGVLG